MCCMLSNVIWCVMLTYQWKLNPSSHDHWCWHNISIHHSSNTTSKKSVSNHEKKKCGCLLWALFEPWRVMGAFFYSETWLQVWNDLLPKNQCLENSNDKLWRGLHISFDSLELDKKKMLLDVVCFFNEYQVEYG